MHQMRHAIFAMAGVISATASSQNATFPFFTFKTFEVEGVHTREDGGFEYLAYAPIVDAGQLGQWEAYSLENQGWIQDSRTMGLARTTLASENFVQTGINPEIHPREDDLGPYLPLWQQSPPPFDAQVINLNLLSEDWMSRLLPAVLVARGEWAVHTGLNWTCCWRVCVVPFSHVVIHCSTLRNAAFGHCGPFYLLVQQSD